MKNALKVLALGVAIAASATMAKADTIYSFNGGQGIVNTTNGTFQFSAAPTSVTTSYTNGTTGGTTFVSPLSFTSPYAVGGSYFYYDNFALDTNHTSFTMTDNASNSMSLVMTSLNAPSPITGIPPTLTISGAGILTIDGISQNGFYTLSEVTGGNASISFTSALDAPTPEPSSLALLGTGLLGMAGIARRRFMSR